MTNFPIIRKDLSLSNLEKTEINYKIKDSEIYSIINNLGQFLIENYNSLEEFMNSFSNGIINNDDFKRFLFENNPKIDSSVIFVFKRPSSLVVKLNSFE